MDIKNIPEKEKFQKNRGNEKSEKREGQYVSSSMFKFFTIS